MRKSNYNDDQDVNSIAEPEVEDLDSSEEEEMKTEDDVAIEYFVEL